MIEKCAEKFELKVRIVWWAHEWIEIAIRTPSLKHNEITGNEKERKKICRNKLLCVDIERPFFIVQPS